MHPQRRNLYIGFMVGVIATLIGDTFYYGGRQYKDWTMVNYFTQRTDCVYIMGQRDPTNNQTKGDVIVCGKDAVNLGKQP